MKANGGKREDEERPPHRRIVKGNIEEEGGWGVKLEEMSFDHRPAVIDAVMQIGGIDRKRATKLCEIFEMVARVGSEARVLRRPGPAPRLCRPSRKKHGKGKRRTTEE